ncbi:hypothetical protein B0T20DRAFT_389771 [Sordaria brevicollis]|uniref:Uncharacterized protein n=1 Tax=Sordaria brevicollis TaxID=83679 RepID=A0AAE0UF69_SORBR|nr:hypothetical protein B0T20DRAFT_389771 [Sordaria brevicollis]
MPCKTLADIRASRERTAALKAQGINPKKILAGLGINPTRMTAPSSSHATSAARPSKPKNASVKNHSNRVTKPKDKTQTASKHKTSRIAKAKAKTDQKHDERYQSGPRAVIKDRNRGPAKSQREVGDIGAPSNLSSSLFLWLSVDIEFVVYEDLARLKLRSLSPRNDTTYVERLGSNPAHMTAPSFFSTTSKPARSSIPKDPSSKSHPTRISESDGKVTPKIRWVDFMSSKRGVKTFQSTSTHRANKPRCRCTPDTLLSATIKSKMPCKKLSDIQVSREEHTRLKAMGINPRKRLAGLGINPPRMTASSGTSTNTSSPARSPEDRQTKISKSTALSPWASQANRVSKSKAKSKTKTMGAAKKGKDTLKEDTIEAIVTAAAQSKVVDNAKTEAKGKVNDGTAKDIKKARVGN